MQFSFGPLLHPHGTVFRLWAPLHDRIGLKLAGEPVRAMQPGKNGWFTLDVAGIGAGTRYRFALPDGREIPDPASRFQPDDVHGPSEVIDLAPDRPRSGGWAGRPWEEIVLYELHVGAFTPEGTFAAAAGRLGHLRDLGVTAVEIMPIGDFAGRRNWGYDGVLPYAPDASYGRPEDLLAFVEAAHRRGICVFLDVVYNHFGPDGNHFAACAPLFTSHHQTPWGDGVNFDGRGSREVREFVIQNALYWLTAYGLDGLRLDAVHAIKDDSDEHLLHALARRVREQVTDREVHLIVENEDNDASLLERDAAGRPRLFTAQWNDDLHHVLHVAATGETFGYYADYAGNPQSLGRALAEGFVFQGETMPYRGERRGSPSRHLPPTAFVSFIHNHDQIGNRAHGDRMTAYADPARLKALAAVYLLLPQVPMLFMGEEWGAREPFPYFCDFHRDLNDAVRKGRREELSRLPGFEANEDMDPTGLSAFRRAKLDWATSENEAGREWLDVYRLLLNIRQRRIVPLLGRIRHAGTASRHGGEIAVTWQTAEGGVLSLHANLSDTPGARPLADATGETFFALGAVYGETLPPWSLRWSFDPMPAHAEPSSSPSPVGTSGATEPIAMHRLITDPGAPEVHDPQAGGA